MYHRRKIFGYDHSDMHLYNLHALMSLLMEDEDKEEEEEKE